MMELIIIYRFYYTFLAQMRKRRDLNLIESFVPVFHFFQNADMV